MTFIKGLIAAVALAVTGGSTAADQVKVPTNPTSVTIVTSCNQIVVVVFVSPTGESIIVDKDSGVSADQVKAIASASDNVLVYEVGCDFDPPPVRT